MDAPDTRRSGLRRVKHVHIHHGRSLASLFVLYFTAVFLWRTQDEILAISLASLVRSFCCFISCARACAHLRY